MDENEKITSGNTSPLSEKKIKKLEKKERKKEKRNRPEAKVSRIVTLIVNAVIIIIFCVFLCDFFGISLTKYEKIIHVNEGDSITSISKKLKDEKIIISDFMFKTFFMLSEPEYMLIPGEFLVDSKLSYSQITERIISGTSHIDDTTNITIPEGYTNKQIIKMLLSNEIINDAEKFENALENYNFEIAGIKTNSKENSLNGFLFPDTYNFQAKSEPEVIITKMTENFKRHWKPEYTVRAEELGMSIEEIVILASIIQQEARDLNDFYDVASVFHNRLKKGMLLQSCATVQFVLDERKTVLTEKDTKIDSPYNTYKYAGLPPTAICSPGDTAIEAALFPNQSDNLYFFCDKYGTTHFSESYDEHINLQKQYPVE